MKKLFAISVLALATLSIGSAKTYEIILSGPSRAGSIDLKPGQYKLKVEGSNAIFTDVNSYKSYTTPVKIETTEKKFDGTRVQSTKDGNVDKIEEIDLGGSKTKLGF